MKDRTFITCIFCSNVEEYFDRPPTHCALCRRSLTTPQSPQLPRPKYVVKTRKSGFPFFEKRGPLVAKATTATNLTRTIRPNAATVLLNDLAL